MRFQLVFVRLGLRRRVLGAAQRVRFAQLYAVEARVGRGIRPTRASRGTRPGCARRFWPTS